MFVLALPAAFALTDPFAPPPPPPISVGFVHADTVGTPAFAYPFADTTGVQAVLPLGKVFAIDARLSLSTGFRLVDGAPSLAGADLSDRIGPRFGGPTGFYGGLLVGLDVPLDGEVGHPGLDAVAGWTFVTARGLQIGPELALGTHGLGLGLSMRWATRREAPPVTD